MKKRIPIEDARGMLVNDYQYYHLEFDDEVVLDEWRRIIGNASRLEWINGEAYLIVADDSSLCLDEYPDVDEAGSDVPEHQMNASMETTALSQPVDRHQGHISIADHTKERDAVAPTYRDLYSYLDNNLPRQNKSCDHTLRHAQQFAKDNHVDWRRLRKVLQDLGGYCDCEVMFNVTEHMPMAVPIGLEDVFVKEKDMTVYHVYRTGRRRNEPRLYWYTLSPDCVLGEVGCPCGSDGCRTRFDVRELPTWQDLPNVENIQQRIAEAIRNAIRQGVLKDYLSEARRREEGE